MNIRHFSKKDIRNILTDFKSGKETVCSLISKYHTSDIALKREILKYITREQYRKFVCRNVVVGIKVYRSKLKEESSQKVLFQQHGNIAQREIINLAAENQQVIEAKKRKALLKPTMPAWCCTGCGMTTTELHPPIPCPKCMGLSFEAVNIPVLKKKTG